MVSWWWMYDAIGLYFCFSCKTCGMRDRISYRTRGCEDRWSSSCDVAMFVAVVVGNCVCCCVWLMCLCDVRRMEELPCTSCVRTNLWLRNFCSACTHAIPMQHRRRTRWAVSDIHALFCLLRLFSGYTVWYRWWGMYVWCSSSAVCLLQLYDVWNVRSFPVPHSWLQGSMEQ